MFVFKNLYASMKASIAVAGLWVPILINLRFFYGINFRIQAGMPTQIALSQVVKRPF